MLKQLVVSLMLVIGFGAQAAAVKPDEALKQTTDQMRSLITANHVAYEADKSKFYEVVDEVLVPRFDVRYIAQLTLGKSWRSANNEQKKRFQAAFKNALIRTYADALLANYDTVEAKYEPLRMAPDATDVTVHASLMRKQGRPVNMAFAMREIDADWKVYDVIIENLSLITNFRSQFGSEIKKNGLEQLIAKMEAGTYFKQNPPKTDK